MSYRNPYLQYLTDAAIGGPRFALTDLNTEDLDILSDALTAHAMRKMANNEGHAFDRLLHLKRIVDNAREPKQEPQSAKP